MEEKPQISDNNFTTINMQQEIAALMQRISQLATRLDTQSDTLARAVGEHASFHARLASLEGSRTSRTDYIQRILLPLLVASLTLSLGNLALSVTILFNVVTHILGGK